MKNKISFLILILISPMFCHGVSESTAKKMIDASLTDYLWFGAEHMVTGYDHILFLLGVLFFLTSYIDILKFITAFTIAHCITLIFATFFGITANPYIIDAIIALSVIYKGFENLNGFKKCFNINPPNLIFMVFLFGLIHGFGLSTKLQEIAGIHNINLSLSQILSFNIGVEVGQITVLIIIFPLLSILRGSYFNKISKLTNWGLVIAGLILFIFQLNNFFLNNNHIYNKQSNEHFHHH